MSSANLVRKAAVGSAVAAAGAATAAAAGMGVLTAQGFAARRNIGPRMNVPPYSDGRYGPRRGISLRLCIVGDSLAAGLGNDYPHQTPGALLAERLVEASGRAVVLSTVAVVGARTEHLAEQVDRALVTRPTVVVISIGANDVTHLVPMRTSADRLGQAVHRLTEAGCGVVVGTCPDLGSVKPIRPPLRNVARRKSRRLAALQGLVTVAEGGFSVSLADLLGPEFAARPGELFSADQFHPNPQGYSAMAEVLGPAVLAAAGIARPELPALYQAAQDLPLMRAAQQASQSPGTLMTPDGPSPQAGPDEAGAALLQPPSSPEWTDGNDGTEPPPTAQTPGRRARLARVWRLRRGPVLE